MAAYVQIQGIWNTSSGSKAAAITPAVGALLVVFIGNTGNTSDPTVTDDRTGGTYTMIGTGALKNGSNDKGFIFIRDALVASAVAHTITVVPGATTGGGFRVVEVSGMTRVGAAAALQSAKQENQAAATTPAPAFGSAAQTANMTLGMVMNATAPATQTQPTNWTERADLGYNSPATGMHVVTRDSGFTGTTITWGSTSSAFCSLIVELDTSSPGGGSEVAHVVSWIQDDF